MAFVCQHCGKEDERFEGTKYTMKYIEEYVADYYQIPVEKLIAINSERKSRIRRGHLYWVLQHECKWTQKEIGKRYGLSPKRIRDRVKNINIKKNEDLRAIIKFLK